MEIPKLSKRMLAKVVKALEVAAINIPPEVIDDDKAVEIAEILIFDLIDEIKKQN